jgi:hypothetical protein
MKFDNTRVYNFEGALRGMRNPKNSWNLSDSYYDIINDYNDNIIDVADAWVKKDFPDVIEGSREFLSFEEEYRDWLTEEGIINRSNDGDYCEVAYIGPKDMHLAQLLIRSGPEHRKFLRQIFVSVDITAPLYWWKEFDTYKVGTVANSTSTMHKLAEYPITKDCFEMGDYDGSLTVFQLDKEPSDIDFTVDSAWEELINVCETLRQRYNETKDVRYWKELVRILPNGWLQTRTVTMNYENLLSICSKGQRRFHKLTEWRNDFINWARTLPYANQFIFIDEQASKDFALN